MLEVIEDFYHTNNIHEITEGEFTSEQWKEALDTPHKISFNHEMKFSGLHTKWTSHHHHDGQRYMTLFRAGNNPTAILISKESISKEDATFIISSWCKEMKGIG